MIIYYNELIKYISRFYNKWEERNIIYGLVDLETGELRYVGMTYRPFKRYLEHHNINNLKSDSYHDNWLRKLINNNQRAEMILIKEYSTYEELENAEAYFIGYFSELGAHLTNSKDYWTHGKPTEETKRKISAGNSGKNHYGFGKPRAESTKKKLSEINKGKTIPEEVKIKMSNSNKGRVKSELERKRISKSKMGDKNPMFGKRPHNKTSDEIIEQMKKARNEGMTYDKIGKMFNKNRITVMRLLKKYR